MPGGRPTKYKPEFCQIVIDEMAQGSSKEAAAGALGVTYQTFYNWMDRHQEFFDAVKEGQTKSRLWWEKVGRAAALGKVPGFQGTPWVFSMKNIHGWSDKVETKHTVTVADELKLRFSKAIQREDGEE